MYMPQWRIRSRGASVLAALVIVAVLGAVAMTLQYAKVTTFAKMSQGQTALANMGPGGVPSTQPVAESGSVLTCAKPDAKGETKTASEESEIDETCLPGQVHTIDQTRSGATAATAQDKIANCYTQPPPNQTSQTAAQKKECILNQAEKANPACAVAQPDKCVVRYCPPASLIKTAGACIVIKCSGGTTSCLKDSMATLQVGQSGPTDLLATALYYDPHTAVVTVKPDGAANGSEFLTQALTDTGRTEVAAVLPTYEDENRSIAELRQLASTVEKGTEPPCYSDGGCVPTFSPNTDLSKVATIQPPDGGETGCGQPVCDFGGGGDTKDPSKPADPSAPKPSAQGPCPNGKPVASDGSCSGPISTFTQPAKQQPGASNPANQSGANNNWLTQLGSFTSGFMKGLTGMGGPSVNPQGQAPAGNTTPQAPGTCSTSYVCGNNTLYYQQNNCVQQPMQQCQYGCSAGATSCSPSPQSQSPYGVGSNGQACPQPQTQPAASSCTTGTWQPQSTNGCSNTSWQCVPGTSGGAQPVAQLSCQPQIADVGMSVAIAFGCQNATSAVGNGFDTSGSTSGSATAVIASPPVGANTANYALTCSNQTQQTASAQCSVQINKPTIVIVTNPSTVPSGSAATIGWVTTGMKSCVISSPNLPEFTAANVSNTSANGVATTPPLTTTANFLLHCQTLGGGIKDATTSLSVGARPLTVSSSADGGSTAYGSLVTITWSSINPPSGSAMSLWLVDLQAQTAQALIAGGQPMSGTYTWRIPNTGEQCVAGSSKVCASHLVAGKSYAVEAIIYTPAHAYVGDGLAPANPVSPTYGASSVGGAFIISQ